MQGSRRNFLMLLAATAATGGTRAIRFGACAKTADLGVIKDAGFDYLEGAASEIADMSTQAFEDFKAKVAAARFPCEAFNGLIRRKELVVTGPSVDLNRVLEYLDGTLDRCKQLGANCIVWGSAGSRNVPDGFPPGKAWDQIALFLSKAGPLGAKYSLRISIEPLNRLESNILNTGHEAWRMVQQVNHPNVQFMIDYYHLIREHESLDIFEIARGHITHTHFSLPLPKGRRWPFPGEDDPNYKAFFAELQKVQWSGGMSVEGTADAAKDAAGAAQFLRAAASS